MRRSRAGETGQPGRHEYGNCAAVTRETVWLKGGACSDTAAKTASTSVLIAPPSVLSRRDALGNRTVRPGPALLCGGERQSRRTRVHMPREPRESACRHRLGDPADHRRRGEAALDHGLAAPLAEGRRMLG